MNNADFGLTLQKMICDKYGLEINDWAMAQFDANYNRDYEEELRPIIPVIFERVGSYPIQLLTYSRKKTKHNQMTSPHNFLLKNGKTLSIRTTRTSDKIAPRTLGQAGFSVLNEYFADVYGDEICSQADVRRLIFEHIHEILPVFIDHLFQSDFTVLLPRGQMENIQVIRADMLGDYSFFRTDFEFTRGLDSWTESTTLKYHGKSIAEIQTHKERTFKFRFIISNIPEWFKIVKENNETLGMSAEAAICDYFHIERPNSFNKRVLRAYVDELTPIVSDAFKTIPPVVLHSGSNAGDRGEQSKCSYDFVLKGNKKLSLKTNKGKMVCPPEVGQPGAKTCRLYFADFLQPGITEVTGDVFKEMVLSHIDEMMPIYVSHLFDSDWLLWIYETKNGFQHMAIRRDDVRDFKWEKNKFSFTKSTLEEWNESNTVKYEGVTIGEFQVHQNRNCYKFRFNMQNLLNLILK